MTTRLNIKKALHTLEDAVRNDPPNTLGCSSCDTQPIDDVLDEIRNGAKVTCLRCAAAVDLEIIYLRELLP